MNDWSNDYELTNGITGMDHAPILADARCASIAEDK
jgi:hypothetical protein